MVAVSKEDCKVATFSVSAATFSAWELRVDVASSSYTYRSQLAPTKIHHEGSLLKKKLALLWSSSRALVSGLISFIDEIDAEPALTGALANAVLAGRLADGAGGGAMLALGAGIALLTPSVIEALGRAVVADDLTEASDAGETTDERAAAAAEAAADGAAGGLLAVDADRLALPEVGVGALGARDCLRWAVGPVEDEMPVAGCLLDVLDVMGGLVAVAAGELVDFLSADVAVTGLLVAEAIAVVVVVVLAAEAVVGAGLTVPDPNVPELMIYSTQN